MNIIQINLQREVANEVRHQGGLPQFKAHALKNLELKTVLKESHCSPIHDVVFNTLDPQHHNLFASVGKDQVTIYDNLHMGDHLGVVVHYVNTATRHHKGGELTCCAWVQTSGITTHPLGDACLAVSGREGVVQVISVVEARVVALLTGHRGEVLDLSGCRAVPGLLLSLGADGCVRLWDVAAGRCLAVVHTGDAVAAELSPDGSCFYTGHRGGRICRWELSVEWREQQQQQQRTEAGAGAGDAAGRVGRSEAGSAAAAAVRRPAGGGCWRAGGLVLRVCGGKTEEDVGEEECWTVYGGGQILSLPGPLEGPVDCLRVIPGGRLAAKSSDGRLGLWSLQPQPGEPGCLPLQLLSVRIPGSHPWAGGAPSGRGGGPSAGNRCRFSITHDGAYLCVGNSAGDVYLYDTTTGGRAARVAAAHKLSGPVRAAALSEDGRHLLAARGNGYVLRYEYIRKQQPAGQAAGPAAAASGQAGAGAETEAEAGPSGGRSPSASPGVTPEPCSSLPAAGQEVEDGDEEEGGKADGIGATGAEPAGVHKRQMGGEAGEQGGATGAKRARMEDGVGAAGAGDRSEA